MKSTIDVQGTIALTRPKVLDFLALLKPELTLLSVLTALAGLYLGSNGLFSPALFFWTFLGTAAVGGGAGALNQLIERDFDLMMRRTQNRPLPSERISPVAAGVFGVAISVSGVALLYVLVNSLTALLAAVTLVTYLFLYTPLKRITPVCTLVGAVPGALPPVMGWTAARNELDPAAWALFAILFLWQMPHFLSLAWLYRRDYERAGYKILTVPDVDGSRTALQITTFAGGLIPAVVLLAWGTGLSMFFTVGAVVTSVVFLIPTIYFMQSRSTSSARIVFLASLLYLPALMVLMLVEKL